MIQPVSLEGCWLNHGADGWWLVCSFSPWLSKYSERHTDADNIDGRESLLRLANVNMLFRAEAAPLTWGVDPTGGSPPHSGRAGAADDDGGDVL